VSKREKQKGWKRGVSVLNHDSSARGTSVRFTPSGGKSEESGPKIPSPLRLNPLCKQKG